MDVNCEPALCALCVQVFDHDEWSRRQADVEFLSRSGAVSEADVSPLLPALGKVQFRLVSLLRWLRVTQRLYVAVGGGTL